MLQNKKAVIYGAGGSVGGAVARAFARQGATIHLVGHKMASLQKVADDIRELGGTAIIAQVDALNERAVNDHINSISQAGSVDVSFNTIDVQDTQNVPLTEMALADFIRPINIAMETQFITASAAGRVMMKQGSGVILSITATPGALGYPLVGGFGPACCAIEGFSRDLATELGPYNIRVVNIRSAGSPDSRPFREALANMPEFAATFIRKLEEDTMLKKLPMLEDIANTATFLASDMAGKITGVTVDVTAGTTNGLNYKTPYIPFNNPH